VLAGRDRHSSMAALDRGRIGQGSAEFRERDRASKPCSLRKGKKHDVRQGQGPVESRAGRRVRASAVAAALCTIGLPFLFAAIGRPVASAAYAGPARPPVQKVIPPTEASTYKSHDSWPYFEPTRIDRNGVTCSYGYAVFGPLKYGPDFRHFDYVNPDAPKGGTFRYAMAQTSFDTMSQFSLLGVFPLSLMYFHDTLMKPAQDEPSTRYGHIADRVCWPKDKSWFEFHLNPRARWNDGTPLTVEDVLFTIHISKTTIGVTQRRIDAAVDRAERTGPQSVRVHMAQKDNPTLPTVVTDMQVLPRHYYRNRDLQAATLEPPVNSGPYDWGTVSPGRWFEVRRKKDYWARDLPVNKGRYNFDVIRHDFYRDALVANEAFLSGQQDAKLENSATRFDVEERLPAFRAGEIKRSLIRYTQPAFYNGIVMNSRRPVLADRTVRQALTLAYDFEWVNRTLLGARHGRITSYFPNSEFEARGMPSKAEVALLAPFRKQLPPEVFTRPTSLPVGGDWRRRRANLLKASRLLDAAGYRLRGGQRIDPRTGRPIAFELLAYSALVDRQTALFIENARRIGIAIRFRTADSALLRHLLQNYQFDLLAGQPTLATYTTPSVGLIQMWSSQAADQPRQLNYPGAKNPAIDAMIDRVVNAKQRATVVNAMRALDRILQWNFYAIPIQHMYPAPLGYQPISYWDRFGRPAREPTVNFTIMTLDSWWVDKARESRLRHRQPR
jgi:microcin C transport system substrate-binding protein